jgi:uncharacterized protein (DUF58 family)
LPTRQPRISEPREKGGDKCRLTGRGIAFLVGSLLLVVGGFCYAVAGLILVGGTGLLLLGLSYPFARYNLAAMRVKRVLPESVYAGQEFPFEFQLTNHRRWDSWAVEYEETVAGPTEKGLSAPWIKRGGTVHRKCQTRLLRRGLQHRAKAILESTFPMGLWKVRRELREIVDVLVYPRPILPRILEDPEFLNMLESDEAESLQFDVSGDFHGIREYQPGDRMKHIDWATTARAGKLMVSVFDKRLPSRYLVIFHSASPRGLTHAGDAFESAIEMLCGLINYAQDHAVPVDFYASFNDWKREGINASPESFRKALEMLAAARRKPETSLEPLGKILSLVDPSSRVFILSDVNVSEWEHAVPSAPCLVTCLSVSEMRVRQPRIYRRELSEATAAAAPSLDH